MGPRYLITEADYRWDKGLQGAVNIVSVELGDKDLKEHSIFAMFLEKSMNVSLGFCPPLDDDLQESFG